MRLTKVDALTLVDHSYLDATDKCYFFGEYTAREGFAYSPTNQLIHNLKKPVSRRGLAEYRYKESAIQTISIAMRASMAAPQIRDNVTFVPMPPSKAPTDPDYDDRLLRVLQNLGNGYDVRSLLRMKQSLQPSHLCDVRPAPLDLYANMEVDPALTAPTPSHVFLFDDVLTTGAHYKAAVQCLKDAFPDATYTGIFVARRVPKAQGI